MCTDVYLYIYIYIYLCYLPPPQNLPRSFLLCFVNYATTLFRTQALYPTTVQNKLNMQSIAYHSLSTTTQTHSNQDKHAKYCLLVYDDPSPLKPRSTCKVLTSIPCLQQPKPGMAGKVTDLFKVYKKQMLMMLYWGLHAQIENYFVRGRQLHLPFATVRESRDSLQFDHTHFRRVLPEHAAWSNSHVALHIHLAPAVPHTRCIYQHMCSQPRCHFPSAAPLYWPRVKRISETCAQASIGRDTSMSAGCTNAETDYSLLPGTQCCRLGMHVHEFLVLQQSHYDVFVTSDMFTQHPVVASHIACCP